MKSVSRQLEDYKATIERFYIQEDKTAKEILNILLEDVEILASENQLKKKLKKWNFNNKNIKAETMMRMARSRANRSLENKRSAFRVNKKPIPDRNIDRFMDRKDICMEDLIDMQSPQNPPSPAFSVFTPDASVSTPPPFLRYDTPSRQLTRTIDFNMLSIMDTKNPVSPVADDNPLDVITYNNATTASDFPNTPNIMDERSQSEGSLGLVAKTIAPSNEDEHSPNTEDSHCTPMLGTTIDRSEDTPISIASAKLDPLESTDTKVSEVPAFEFPPSHSQSPSNTAEDVNRYFEATERFLASELLKDRKTAERYSRSHIEERLSKAKISDLTLGTLGYVLLGIEDLVRYYDHSLVWFCVRVLIPHTPTNSST
ncbi:hypothetical protein DL98DRAFT_610684 [Cadophora sp. DSE1049]|nr:hypothetical protein DL98DRAFT_610684 [Cadophora sp. DSE1049]